MSPPSGAAERAVRLGSSTWTTCGPGGSATGVGSGMGDWLLDALADSIRRNGQQPGLAPAAVG